MQKTSKTAIFLFKYKQRRNPQGNFEIEDFKHVKILIFRQKLTKRVRICVMISFLQVLMALSKNLILHPP